MLLHKLRLEDLAVLFDINAISLGLGSISRVVAEIVQRLIDLIISYEGAILYQERAQ